MIWQVIIIYVVTVAGINFLARSLRTFAYDLHSVNRRTYQFKHPHTKANRKRPLVTVIVWSDNNSSALNICLQGLKDSSYKKLQLLIVDNASSDGSAQVVRQFLKSNPKMDAKFIAKRKAAAQMQALKSVKSYVTGDLVLVLPASAALRSDSMRKAVYYMNAEDAACAVLHSRQGQVMNLSSLIGIYIGSLKNQQHKYSMPKNINPCIFRAESYADYLRSPQAIAYISESVAQDFSTKGLKPAFIDWVTGRNQEVKGLQSLSPQSLWAWPKYFASMLTPLVLAYFVYLAIFLHQPALYIASCVAIAISVSMPLLNDESLNWAEKIQYILLLPITQIAIYLYLLLPLLNAFYALYKVVLKQASQLGRKLQARTA